MLTVETIKQSLAPVFKKYQVLSATLFGSYAKGTANDKSDVDLIVDSSLRGFVLMELYCAVQDALGGIDLDLFAKYELVPNGCLDLEVKSGEYGFMRFNIKDRQVLENMLECCTNW